MRKDRKSQYTIKKEKLLEIRNELLEAKQDLFMNKRKQPLKPEEELNYLYHVFDKIWEIVTNEKK